MSRHGIHGLCRPAAAAALVAAALLSTLTAGCTSPPTPPAGTPTPPVSLRTASQPAPTGPEAMVQAAVAAYRGMWAAYEAAIAVPGPTSPELARYATGDALASLVRGLTSVKDRGLRGTGKLTLSPQVTELSPVDAPTSVSIRDCFDDSATRLVRVSGPPYSDTPGGRRLCLATVKRGTDGTWKVTSYGLREVGTC